MVSRFVVGLAAVAMLAGCGRYEPKPTAEPTQPLEPPEAKSLLPEAGPNPNLDRYGNLRGSDNRVLGFEMPLGAKATGQGRNQFVSSSEDRFVRFYRSRGYKVKPLMEGSFTISHSDRSLAPLTAEDTEAFQNASMFVSVGPGQGYTLLFNPGRPPELARPLLDELRAAEAQFDPAFKKAQKARQEALAKRARALAAKAEAERKKQNGFGGAPPKGTLTKKKVASAGQPVLKRKTYTVEDVKVLRRKAKERLSNPRVKKMYDKIRDWERETGQTFLH